MKSPVKLQDVLQRAFLMPLFLGLIAITCSACDPTNRIVWSPDGKQMAVIGGDGLHLGTADGALSPVLLASAELAAWLPDSRRLLVVRHKETNDWRYLEEVLPAADVKTIVSESARVRKAIISYKGDWNKFDQDDSLSNLHFGPEDIIYLRFHDNAELQKAMGAKWREIETMKAGIWDVQVYEAGTNTLSAERNIYTGIRHIEDVRLSKDGLLVAISESTKVEGGPTYRINVVSIAGGVHKTVADLAAKYPDWTPDNKSLVFIESRIRQPNSDLTDPGTLRKVTLGENQPVHDTATSATLAEVVFRSNDRVRCLPDGTILFSCPKVSLPSSIKDTSYNRQRVFKFDGSKQPAVTDLTESFHNHQLGDLAEYFEPNAEGSKVAIPDHNGYVCVINLSNGSFAQSPAPKGPEPIPFIPQWRLDDQLCIPFISEANTISGIGLWSTKSNEQKRISTDWPGPVLKGFLK